MKKVLWCVLMMMAGALWLQAQTEAGNVLLGTTTELNSSISSGCPNSAALVFGSTKYESDGDKVDGPNTSAFNVSPRVGFFVADDVLIGANVSLLYNKQKSDNEYYSYTMTTTAVSAGPFVRYYFAVSEFKPFIQAGFTAGQLKEKESDDYGDDEYKYNMMSYHAGAGGAFFLSKKVSVDFSVNYIHSSLKDPDDSSDGKALMNAFGFDVGFSMFL